VTHRLIQTTTVNVRGGVRHERHALGLVDREHCQVRRSVRLLRASHRSPRHCRYRSTRYGTDQRQL